jgi:hypothetical protein
MRRLGYFIVVASILTCIGSWAVSAASKMTCDILRQKVKVAKTQAEKSARQRDYESACGKLITQSPAPVKSSAPVKPESAVKKPKPKVAVRKKPTVKKSHKPIYTPPPLEVTVEGSGRRYPTIQSAINAVGAGGTIWVTTPYVSEADISVSKSVSIIGAGDSKTGVILDLKSFTVNGGNVYLKNINISSSGSYPVSIYGGSLTIQNSSIDQQNGTALQIDGGILNVDNSIITSVNGHRIVAYGSYSLKVTNSYFYGDNLVDILAKKSGFVDLQNNYFLSNNGAFWLCMEPGVSYIPYSNNVGQNNIKILSHYYFDPVNNTCYK